MESPLPQIDQGPDSLNVSILDYAQFACTASNVDTILWLVDGNAIETIPNLVDEQESHSQVNTTITKYYIKFLIGRDLDYTLLNGSIITCKGLEYAGSQSTSVKFSNSSSPATLLIEGW